MPKKFFLLTLILLTNSMLSGQQLPREDYKIYATLIKTEILDSIKSVAIISNVIDIKERKEEAYLIADNLTSADLNYKYQVYFETENDKKERPTVIDSVNARFLINYCKSKNDKFTLTNNFNLLCKTILIRKFPIRKKSVEQDWKDFYKKCPGSGGIFSFSKVSYYSTDKTTAIFYYWHRRQGLNGHGALAILTKTNGEWKMKYKTYVWFN